MDAAEMTEAEPARTRIVLVDDSADIRLLIRSALDLEDDLEVVAKAADGAIAIAAAEAVAAGADVFLQKQGDLTALVEAVRAVVRKTGGRRSSER